MKQFNGLIIIFCLMGLTACSKVSNQNASPETPQKQEAKSATVTSLSFGDVADDKTVLLSVTITNNGTEPLTGTPTITSATPAAFSIPYVQTAACSNLAVNKTCLIKISLSAKLLTSGIKSETLSYDSLSFPVSANILPAPGSAENPVVKTVLMPAEVDFGTMTTSQSILKTITIQNTSTISLLEPVTVSPPFILSYNGCTASLLPGKSCSVKVSLSGSSGAGNYQSHILSYGIVGSSSLKGIVQSPAQVAVLSSNVVAVYSAQTLAPGSTTSLGTLQQNTSQLLNVSLKNIGTGAATVSSINFTSPQMSLTYNSCQGLTLQPGGTCLLKIALSPSGVTPVSLVATLAHGDVRSFNFAYNFQEIKTLSVTASAKVSLTSTPAGINCSSGTCTKDFIKDTTVSINATPVVGYQISSWAAPSGCSRTGNQMSCVLSSNTSLSLPSLSCASGYITSGTTCILAPVSGPAEEKIVFFQGQSKIYGREIFSLDTLTENMSLTADVNQATQGSNPSQFSIVNNKLYFVADSGLFGQEIHRYDPVTNQVTIPEEFFSGNSFLDSDFYYLRSMVAVGNKLLLTVNSNAGSDLYEFDTITNQYNFIEGVSSGTNVQTDLQILVKGNLAYYRAYDSSNQLRIYNAATGSISSINMGTIDFYGYSFFIFDDYLVGSGYDYSSSLGTELLVFNTNTNTFSFKDIYPGINNSSEAGKQDSSVGQNTFVKIANKLYFPARTANGQELWSYDFNADTVSLVADLNTQSSSASSSPRELVVANNKLYFTAVNSATGRELVEYDPSLSVSFNNSSPTAGGSNPKFYDINIGASGANPYYLIEANDKLHLVVNQRIVQFDPITKSMTNDGYSGQYVVQEAYTKMFFYDNYLYFRGISNSYGTELHRYNVLTNQTSLVSNVDPDNSYQGNPIEITQVNGKIVYTGQTMASGIELYSFNPASSQFALVADLDSTRTLDGAEGKFYKIGNFLYLEGTMNGYSSSYKQLVKVNLTTQERVVIDSNLNPSSLIVGEGKVFYTTLPVGSETNAGMKKYDPSTNQITLLVNHSDFYSQVSPSIALNNKVFFVATSFEIGVEWHYYDLATNTVTGIDFNPEGDSYPYDPKVLGGKIYYITQDSNHQGKLAQLNPQNGHITVIDHLPGKEGDVSEVTEANGKIYFTANMDDEDYFYTMYEYNPANNTLNQRSAGLIPEDWTSYPHGYVGFNNKVYFVDNDDSENFDNYELFVYEPTLQSSHIAFDYNPDGSSNPSAEYSITNNKLYFMADNGESGYEPVYWDPINEQVNLLIDYTPGSSSTFAQKTFAAGDDFYIMYGSNPSPKFIKINTLNFQTQEISLPHLYTIESVVTY